MFSETHRELGRDGGTGSAVSVYTIDFETRSKADIKKGAWRYAEDPSTDVLCLVIKKDDEDAVIWVPGWVLSIFDGDEPTSFPVLRGQELLRIIADMKAPGNTVEAHNAEFERAVWEKVMHGKYKLPSLENARWSCTAARAARLALPRSLDAVAKVIGASAQKDGAGHKLMMKMCKPRTPRKAEKAADPEWDQKDWWHETPEQIVRLCEYCVRDVEAEHAVSQLLPELPPDERKIWELDYEINKRGIRVDVDAIDRILRLRSEYRSKLVDELQIITGDRTMTENKVESLLAWLKDRGYELENLAKDTVGLALEEMDLDPAARRVLEIRRTLAKTSVRKYTTMLRSRCCDGRLRSQFMYHGAATGRWSGKNVQVHNLPRGNAVPDFESAHEALKAGAGPDDIELLFGDVMDFCSALIRTVLVPGPGNIFMTADYSAIEGRVLAWLAGERHTLQQYLDGLDLYKVAASIIYGAPYEEVDKQQRSVGKVSELALGYQGGIGAYVSMGANYGLRAADYEAIYPEIAAVSTPEEVMNAQDRASDYLAQNPGSRLTMCGAIACDLVKQKWRTGRPQTVQFWYDLDDAAMSVVRCPGKSFWAGKIRFVVQGSFLRAWLPSGRALAYFRPHIGKVRTPWGDLKDAVHYYGADSKQGNKWCRQHLYGGKLAENVTQATARDLLRDAMLRCDGRWPVHLHVHDEIVSEVPVERAGEFDAFCQEMARVPAWAEGLPVEVDGWTGIRYHK